MTEMFKGIEEVRKCPDCNGRMVHAIFTLLPVILCVDTSCHRIDGVFFWLAYRLAALFSFMGVDALVFTAYNKGKYWASLGLALFGDVEEE